MSGLQARPPEPRPRAPPAYRFRPRGLKGAPPWRLLWVKGGPRALGCPRRPPRSVELIPGKLVLLGSTWKQRTSLPETAVLTPSSPAQGSVLG